MQNENTNFDYQAFCEQMQKSMPKAKKSGLGIFFKTAFALIIVAGLGFSLFANFVLLKRYNTLADKLNGVETPVNKSEQIEHESNEGQSLAATMSTQQVVKQAISAVVAIKTEVEVQNFWGKDMAVGAGSGVLIDKEGYIVTNYHVVEGAQNISIKLASDEKPHKAELVASDSRTDLAVLKIVDKKGPFPFIHLADSDKVEIGEKAIAIGNPLGDLEGTVTQGIISGMNREVYTKSAQSGKLTRLSNVLQTDASINAGNSGGALLNARGELIGINTAKATSRDGVSVEGIGFAIPSNTVKKIINELLKNGYVSGRPYLGVRVTDLTESNSAMYGMPVGVYVIAVEKNSAADKAGLRRHDIITKLDGEDTKNSTMLNAIKDRYKAGDTAELEVWRQGELKKIKVTFGEVKPEASTPEFVDKPNEIMESKPDESFEDEKSSNDNHAKVEGKEPEATSAPKLAQHEKKDMDAFK